MKPCITCAAFAAVAIITAGQFVSADSKPAKVGPGATAPTFELKDQDGKTVSLADYKDKVVVLEWFNDECPFVKKQYTAGDMNKTADAYEAKQVVWLAINSTHGSSVDHIKSVSGDWKIERPVLDDSAGTVGKEYGARTTPHMFVINKGTVVYAGAIDSKRSTEQSDIATSENYVAKALDEVLAGKPVTTPQTEPYGCGVKYGN